MIKQRPEIQQDTAGFQNVMDALQATIKKKGGGGLIVGGELKRPDRTAGQQGAWCSARLRSASPPRNLECSWPCPERSSCRHSPTNLAPCRLPESRPLPWKTGHHAANQMCRHRGNLCCASITSWRNRNKREKKKDEA